MRIHDISLTISESLVLWPSDPPVQLSRPQSLMRGDGANITHVSMGVHTGTHIDAPLHSIPDGTPVEDLDLTTLIGSALVIDALHLDVITASALEKLAIPLGTERLLFHTKNSQHWARGESAFFTDFVGVSVDGAKWLVQNDIKLVGIDYISIAPFEDMTLTHSLLLEEGVLILEGLNMHGIPPGIYELICLPLKIARSDGAPARVVLLELDQSVGRDHDPQLETQIPRLLKNVLR